MREILFRGKDILCGDWVEGDLIRNENYCYPAVFIGCIEASRNRYDELSIDGHYLPQVAPDAVGQYTGMKDKNGKQIFEGDIIKAKIEGGNHEGFTWPNMRVEFEQGAFCLVHGEHNRLCNFNGLAPSVSLEVIGNIHDNPELIAKEATND